jgi:amino acid transporter
MAVATVEERQLLKAIRWWDGFVIALCNPGFLIASLGYSIGALGGWGAFGLWTISMTFGMVQSWPYAEMAAMFPEKSGGISLYAHEAWRKYFSFIGPVATFGYWFAWSSVLAIFGLVIGYLVQAEWATGQTWSASVLGHDLGFPHVIAAVVIFAVWVVNIFGIRPAVWVAYATGALLMVPLAVFMFVPYITGDFHSSNLHWTLGSNGSPWLIAVVWLYIMGWSSYGPEVVATFAPEYKDTVRDVSIALRTSAVFSLAVYALLPLGITGVAGEQAAIDDPIAFYVPAFKDILGGGSNVMVVFLIASLLLSMNAATADGSRALYGISRDGMTIKELFHLNRFHVPARAMTLDLLVNLALVFFLGSTISILFAGNLGYFTAVVFAQSAFLLLRKDRPKWPRPFKLRPYWIPITVVMLGGNLLFLTMGASHPALTGYGGKKEIIVGVSVLLFAIILFAFRRIVQDKEHVHFREVTPEIPEAVAAPTPAMAGAPPIYGGRAE